MSESKRISISLRGGDSQHEKWKKAAREYYGGNLSAMIVNLVEENIEKKSNDSPDSSKLRGAMDRVDGEVKRMREVLEELIVLQRGNGDSSEERKAARDLLEYILNEGDVTPAEIHAKFEPEHEPEAIDGALDLLTELGVGDFKLKNSEGGENKDD